MGHHFLPQHYLRGFAEGVKLWAYDIPAGKKFPTQVKSVANETDMYSEDLESYLANSVEGPAQVVIDRVRNRIAIDQSERKLLAEYIIAMWKRVPVGRERVASHVPQLAETIRRQFVSQLEAIAENEPDFADLAKIRRTEVDQIISSYQADPPDYFWHHTLRTGATPRTVEELLSMEWTFLVTPGEHFITCDNPVFFFKSEGIGRSQSELSIPLGSEVSLWAHRTNSNRPQFFPTDRATVLELNRRAAHNCQRFMYTRVESPWLLSFAKRKHLLHRLF